MAVLISTKVKGQTTGGYNAMLAPVAPSLKSAEGFIFHAAHPAESAWRVYEVWESKELADKWFAQFIVPNLPEAVHPKRSYQLLHSAVK